MSVSRGHVGAAFLVGACILTACSGGGGPSSLPTAVSPSIVTPSVAAPQSVRDNHKRHPRDTSVCTTTPVNGLQVTTTSMTLAPNASDQFTACTQYASTYSITVSPSGVLTAPKNKSSVTPMVQPTTIKTATITVTAGATCGNATITIKDKKGKTQTVNVTVLCSQTFSFSAPGGVQTLTVPAGVTHITIDAVGASGGRGCLMGFGYINAGGLGYELKASGIAVTPGQTLYVYVGGSPVANTVAPCAGFPLLASYAGGGFNGGGTGFLALGTASSGGGGGASDVRTSSNDLTTRVLVAGGGGGGATTSRDESSGGNGGYPDGAAGGYAFVNGADPGSSFAGQGGTQASGGPGGQAPSFQGVLDACSGNQGSPGIGGSDSACGGGAGGGGYYGGGSSASFSSDNSSGYEGVSAGGGGSSFAQNGATIITQQVAKSGQCDANNNGCITITY